MDTDFLLPGPLLMFELDTDVEICTLDLEDIDFAPTEPSLFLFGLSLIEPSLSELALRCEDVEVVDILRPRFRPMVTSRSSERRPCVLN